MIHHDHDPAPLARPRAHRRRLTLWVPTLLLACVMVLVVLMSLDFAVFEDPDLRLARQYTAVRHIVRSDARWDRVYVVGRSDGSLHILGDVDSTRSLAALRSQLEAEGLSDVELRVEVAESAHVDDAEAALPATPSRNRQSPSH